MSAESAKRFSDRSLEGAGRAKSASSFSGFSVLSPSGYPRSRSSGFLHIGGAGGHGGSNGRGGGRSKSGGGGSRSTASLSLREQDPRIGEMKKSASASDGLRYSLSEHRPHQSKVLERVKKDHVVITNPVDNHQRRTILVQKKNGTYGFTLQTYGIHRTRLNQTDLLTYVDYVELHGAAHLSGMRAGDIILSINGVNMEDAEHQTIVDYIRRCRRPLRMVVMFEDCVRKVELHLRCIKLKEILARKMTELRDICDEEELLLQKLARLDTTKSATESMLSEAFAFNRACEDLADGDQRGGVDLDAVLELADVGVAVGGGAGSPGSDGATKAGLISSASTSSGVSSHNPSDASSRASASSWRAAHSSTVVRTKCPDPRAGDTWHDHGDEGCCQGKRGSRQGQRPLCPGDKDSSQVNRSRCCGQGKQSSLQGRREHCRCGRDPCKGKPPTYRRSNDAKESGEVKGRSRSSPPFRRLGQLIPYSPAEFEELKWHRNAEDEDTAL